MDRIKINSALDKGNIIWRKHALEKIFERNIKRENVIEVIKNGLIIENYPSDKPFPSALLLGKTNDKPMHVVISLDELDQIVYIITAYEPSAEIFGEDFKTRKKL